MSVDEKFTSKIVITFSEIYSAIETSDKHTGSKQASYFSENLKQVIWIIMDHFSFLILDFQHIKAPVASIENLILK